MWRLRTHTCRAGQRLPSLPHTHLKSSPASVRREIVCEHLAEEVITLICCQALSQCNRACFRNRDMESLCWEKDLGPLPHNTPPASCCPVACRSPSARSSLSERSHKRSVYQNSSCSLGKYSGYCSLFLLGNF